MSNELKTCVILKNPCGRSGPNNMVLDSGFTEEVPFDINQIGFKEFAVVSYDWLGSHDWNAKHLDCFEDQTDVTEYEDLCVNGEYVGAMMKILEATDGGEISDWAVHCSYEEIKGEINLSEEVKKLLADGWKMIVL
jgi:hypothetical protein